MASRGEFLPENEHPYNQAAKRQLLQAGQTPDAGGLYVLQLMSWALETGRVVVAARFNPSLRDNVEGMLSWKPANVLHYLEPDPDEQCLNPDELERESPVDAAHDLLDLLHGRLQSNLPGYELESDSS